MSSERAREERQKKSECLKLCAM